MRRRSPPLRLQPFGGNGGELPNAAALLDECHIAG